MTIAIKVQDLSKIYYSDWLKKGKEAIRGVSFSIETGEAFGFIGPNGAGKSTTIKILMGLQKPSVGNAWLHDLPVSDPASRRGVAYVPENPYLFDYLTPLETLRMGLKIHRRPVSEIESHCLGWLERFDLLEVKSHRIRSFSKGMTQRVALAHAMAVEPRLLILDEPLSGLDPVGRRLVVEILSEFKRKGGSILFTSHVLHDVEHLADRFGMIHRGEMRTVSSPAQLIGADDLVMVRTEGDAPISGMIQDGLRRWSSSVRREALWEFLEAVHSAGHSVVEVRPALSLEAVFMRILGESLHERAGHE